MRRRPVIDALAAFTGAMPAGAQAAPGIDVGDLSGVLLSLALVVGFIFVAAFVLKRTPFGAAGRSNGLLKVIAALPLGPRERLVLVEARGEELLIAVSPAGVFNVKTTAPDTTTAAAPTQPAAFTLGAEQ